MDKVDSLEAAILGLNETVAANHDLMMANHALTQRQIAELNEKMDAIIKHLDVPYKPVGFIKD